MPGDGRSVDSSEMYFRAGQILPVRIIDLPIHVKGPSEAPAIEMGLTYCGQKKVLSTVTGNNALSHVLFTMSC